MEVVLVFVFAWSGLLGFSAVVGALTANAVALIFRPLHEKPSLGLFAAVFLFVSYGLILSAHRFVFVPVWNKL